MSLFRWAGKERCLLRKRLLFLRKRQKVKLLIQLGLEIHLYPGFLHPLRKRKIRSRHSGTGVASGSATAFRMDLCEKKDVLALLDQVLISSLDEGDVK